MPINGEYIMGLVDSLVGRYEDKVRLALHNTHPCFVESTIDALGSASMHDSRLEAATSIGEALAGPFRDAIAPILRAIAHGEGGYRNLGGNSCSPEYLPILGKVRFGTVAEWRMAFAEAAEIAGIAGKSRLTWRLTGPTATMCIDETPVAEISEGHWRIYPEWAHLEPWLGRQLAQALARYAVAAAEVVGPEVSPGIKLALKEGLFRLLSDDKYNY